MCGGECGVLCVVMGCVVCSVCSVSTYLEGRIVCAGD